MQEENGVGYAHQPFSTIFLILSTKDGDKIRKYFGSLDRSTEMIIENAISLTYYMRGGISYDDMLQRTPGERAAIAEFIEKRLEAQKGSMNPVY